MNFKKQIICKAFSIFTIIVNSIFIGCKPNSVVDSYTQIKGKAGTPRFNLQFTNSNGSDVDLYVKTPNGSIICYRNLIAQKGKMDIDCLCGGCPNGPNENIYWVAGTAPKGVYTIWVQYFDPCFGNNGSADYVVRVMDGEMVLKSYTGKCIDPKPFVACLQVYLLIKRCFFS